MLDRIARWFEFNGWYLRPNKPPWDTGISPPELYAFINAHAPGRALDLGCGTGTNVITLAQRGWQVAGVDFAIKAIAQACRKTTQANVKADLRVGDVTRLHDVRGPFDLILDIGCFHGLSQHGMDAYATNIKRLLTPHGTMLLYAQFKQGASQHSGIVDGDLARFSPMLLAKREDGMDTARGRPSAWFTFERVA